MEAHIAVLGAGTMGGGIAELFAGRGMSVALYDPHESALERAGRRLVGGGRIAIAADDGATPSRDAEAARPGGAERGRLRLTASLAEAARGACFVFEAGPERLETKRELFRDLAPLLGEDAVVASNTSTLSLVGLAERQPFADRLVVAHFFNPAAVVPLVELVGLPVTRPGVLERIAALLADCGKTPVVLKKDCPGFIANRLQAAVLREACHLLRSGVADAEQIDLAMTEGPGLRWALNGPLAIADYGGLDIWESVAGNLFPLLDNGPDAPESIRDMVRQGRLGFKSGAGFYEYGEAAERERIALGRERALRELVRTRDKERSES
ncbi:3-hydroxyacyl-CoA dehydrogenase family protein [Paenibacillus sp. GYB003]|uniref:3-hydroxyacyl-CoA dehydrogenase family protein n=1 Tax=Paenibacillus sp. GYB003 TaxID=2994392 RepID=UPI002F9665B2